MTTKHTPGPWKVDGSGMGIYTDAALTFQPMVALTTMPDVDLATCKANGALVASAPDLLVALEAMVKTFGNSTVLSDYGREQVKVAKAAISKAKGE